MRLKFSIFYKQSVYLKYLTSISPRNLNDVLLLTQYRIDINYKKRKFKRTTPKYKSENICILACITPIACHVTVDLKFQADDCRVI